MFFSAIQCLYWNGTGHSSFPYGLSLFLLKMRKNVFTGLDSGYKCPTVLVYIQVMGYKTQVEPCLITREKYVT